MSGPDKLIKGASKLFFKGTAGEGALAKNLGEAVGAKAIQDSLSASKLADDTLKLLKETDSPVHKTTGADLISLAKKNPTASPKELVSLYHGGGTGVTVNQSTTAFNKMQAGQPPSPTSKDYVLLYEGDENSNRVTGLEGMASPPEEGPRGMGALAPTPTTEGVLVGKGETSAQQYAKDNARRERAKEQFQQSRTNKDTSDQTVQRYAPEVTSEVTPEVPPVDIPDSKFPTKKVVGGAAAAGTVAAALASSDKDALTGVPTGGETAKSEEVKRAPTPPTAPSPQGVDGTKPPVTKPVTPGKESQATTTGALKSAVTLANKLENGKSDKVSKSSLDELTKTLDDVEETVSADPRFQNTPVERNLQSARAEAYKMYKEKADRNQLLGTVERAINAIAQFASAQAGFGTRQAGGNLPLSSADYGGQTAQAFKEYETEVGLIGEEQKAGERASDRKEALKEKEINRQRGTILERIETERNALKETAAENRARIAEGGRQASLNAAEARAIKRENDAIAKGNVKDITKNLSVLDAEITALTSMLNPVKPADAVLGLNKYAALTGVDVGGVKEGIAAVSGISWKAGDTLPSVTSNKAATKEFATAELEKVRARRKELADSLAQYTKSVPPATEAPTGQPAASSGMVDMIDPGGRPLLVPENKVAELEAVGAKRK